LNLDTYILSPENPTDSAIAHLDPRTRVVVALTFSGASAILHTGAAIAGACAVAVWAIVFSRIPLRQVAARLAPVNLFLLMLLLFLPFSTPGTPLFRLGPLVASVEGMRQAIRTSFKANAIVLWVTAFLGTMEPAVFGHALHRLRTPQRLVHLLLFTVRYIDVLRREYTRMRQAMRARAFRAGTDLHTYRSIGHLVGMLLVRSIDRSERILAAMKCRGFRGDYYVLERSRFGLRDVWMAAHAIATLAILFLLEALCRVR